MESRTLMKDGLGKPAINRISQALTSVMPDFPSKEFIRQANSGLQGLELKQRVIHIIHVLHDYMPEDFAACVKVLIHAYDHWDWGDPDDPMRGFAAWPLIDYVSVYGLHEPRRSLRVLKRLTPLFTAEFAIRPFLIQHYDLTYAQLQKWSNDKSEHVRRLVSEGTRPRLPWGPRLPIFIRDPAPVIHLLEIIKDDPSEMVRRSVANNLNDISKDNPNKVISLCARWQKQVSKERQWIIRHACRSLIKAGNEKVFPLLGYSVNAQIEIIDFKLDKKNITLGESLKFSLELHSSVKKQQKLIVDYAIHHVKANQSLKPKVFKLKTVELDSFASVKIDKHHAFKSITTREYYSGKHLIEIMINGKSMLQREFVLQA